MIPIVSLLVVLTLSLLITRIASVALAHTGLSRESARFQARSAFSGVGFTTNESEKVVNHPVRRRILLTLMLLGNAGIVTAISSLMLTFVQVEDDASLALRFSAIAAGIAALWAAARSQWIDVHLSTLIDRMLRRYTALDVQDYARLLDLAGDYRVSELAVTPGDWIDDRTLGNADLRQEGIVVLGIHRANGDYDGTPDGDAPVRGGDTLILYGRAAALESLDQRRRGWAGDREHAEAVAEQRAVDADEANRRQAAEPEEEGRPDPSVTPTKGVQNETNP